MFPASGRCKLSFVIGLTVYAAGIAFLVAIGAHAAWLVAALLDVRAAPAENAQGSQRLGAHNQRASLPSAGAEGLMTTLADRWPDRWPDRWSNRWDGRWDGRGGGAYGRPPPAATRFGAGLPRPSRNDDDEPFAGDEERPATFRTVCVRLCDGYYFPISFAVGADRLERDARVCESRCGAQGRLFVHENPGGSIDDLRDLTGRPYRQLRTAFLYRSEYIASCSCQAQPWEQASLDRHRAYALAGVAARGSREAAKELKALQAKLKDDTKPAASLRVPSDSGDVWQPGTSAAKAAEIARREDGNYMGLGGKGAPAAKAEPPSAKSRPDQDWLRRIFDPSAGR